MVKNLRRLEPFVRGDRLPGRSIRIAHHLQKKKKIQNKTPLDLILLSHLPLQERKKKKKDDLIPNSPFNSYQNIISPPERILEDRLRTAIPKQTRNQHKKQSRSNSKEKKQHKVESYQELTTK